MSNDCWYFLSSTHIYSLEFTSRVLHSFPTPYHFRFSSNLMNSHQIQYLISHRLLCFSYNFHLHQYSFSYTVNSVKYIFNILYSAYKSKVICLLYCKIYKYF